MGKQGKSYIGLLLAMGMLVGSGAMAQGTYLSPLAVAAAPGGDSLYVAEATANQVAVYTVADGAVARCLALPGAPTGLALTGDGALLYVTTDAAGGSLHAVGTADGAIAWSLATGHGATAPAVSADGGTVYVCNRFDDAVAVVDVASKQVAARIPVLREPISAALGADGTTLLVANHLPSGAADQDYVSCAVSIVDTAARKVAKQITLPNGCTSLRGICLSPDGAYAYVTHILGRYQLPTTQLERGWMNTNALSVVDVAKQELVNTVLLDDVDSGAANPWGVACSADGAFLCVTHAGIHEVSVIDRVALHDKLTKVAGGEKVSDVSLTADDVPNDLSFLVDLRRRIKLAGNGPRGLVVLGTTVYAAEYYTDSIGSVDINPEAVPRPKSTPLGPETPMTAERRGEMLFHDADLCFQHWQSCTSCHPDSRADGLNWDLLNDGMGNPKNTKSMLFAHVTPPAMVSGIRSNAETAVRAGIRHIQFAVRPEKDAEDIDAYLKSMRPLPSPHLVNGALSEAAKRGEAVFEKAACTRCHTGEYYSNLSKFNVGTGRHREVDMEFDTPALNEAWRTAPYLHDGRSATMEQVLTVHNVDDRHGVTSTLTPEELKDLAEYVLSL